MGRRGIQIAYSLESQDERDYWEYTDGGGKTILKPVLKS
jgi:hypothetical protein